MQAGFEQNGRGNFRAGMVEIIVNQMNLMQPKLSAAIVGQVKGILSVCRNADETFIADPQIIYLASHARVKAGNFSSGDGSEGIEIQHPRRRLTRTPCSNRGWELQEAKIKKAP